MKEKKGRKNGSTSHFCCNLKPWNNEAKNLKGYTQEATRVEEYSRWNETD